jgi:hypothetical protein
LGRSHLWIEFERFAVLLQGHQLADQFIQSCSHTFKTVWLSVFAFECFSSFGHPFSVVNYCQLELVGLLETERKYGPY